jgi:hypothetical protein
MDFMVPQSFIGAGIKRAKKDVKKVVNEDKKISVDVPRKEEFFVGSKPTSPSERSSVSERLSIKSNVSNPTKKVDSGIELLSGTKNRLSVMVLSCEQIQDEWMYTLEVKRFDQPDLMLFRSDNDFWTLHLLLLHSCPKQSGEAGARTLPILDQVTKKMSLSEALVRRRILNFYVQELQYLSLLGVENGSINRFFSMREGDYEAKAMSESLGMVMDRLHGLKSHRTIPVSIVHEGTSYQWKESQEIHLHTLLQIAETKIGSTLDVLFYENEVGKVKAIQNDKELSLIVHGREKLVLFT